MVEEDKFQKLVNRRKSRQADRILKKRVRDRSNLSERIEKRKNRERSKRMSSIFYAINEVRQVARRDTWTTNHCNCFRCSPSIDGKGESDAHIRKKFELFLEYRKLGYICFTELILDSNLGRPDLVVCGNDGGVEIIEIVESESEASLKKKENKYPWPIKVVKA
jgi:hypothetical protein